MKRLKEVINTETLNLEELMAIKGAAIPPVEQGCGTYACVQESCTGKACETKACSSSACNNTSCNSATCESQACYSSMDNNKPK
jgi:hypothetical protein